MLYCYLVLVELYIFVILYPYLVNTSKFYILKNIKNYIEFLQCLGYMCSIHLCNLFVTKLVHVSKINTF